MKILAFGKIAEITGSTCWDEPLAFADVGSFKEHCFRQWPVLKSFSFAISVNRVIAEDNTPLDNGAELALLPPFSGG